MPVCEDIKGTITVVITLLLNGQIWITLYLMWGGQNIAHVMVSCLIQGRKLFSLKIFFYAFKNVLYVNDIFYDVHIWRNKIFIKLKFIEKNVDKKRVFWS